MFDRFKKLIMLNPVADLTTHHKVVTIGNRVPRERNEMVSYGGLDSLTPIGNHRPKRKCAVHANMALLGCNTLNQVSVKKSFPHTLIISLTPERLPIMAKNHDRTRTAEAKQETLRRRQVRTIRQFESRTNNRAIKLLSKGY